MCPLPLFPSNPSTEESNPDDIVSWYLSSEELSSVNTECQDPRPSGSSYTPVPPTEDSGERNRTFATEGVQECASRRYVIDTGLDRNTDVVRIAESRVRWVW